MSQTQADQLFDAAANLDVAAVERLLKEGADANARRQEPAGWSVEEQSPLGVALHAGRYSEKPACIQVCTLLFQHGADPSFGTRDNIADNAPLKVVTRAGQPTLLTLLLEHGAEPRSEHLISAIEESHLEVIKILVAHDRDLLVPNDDSPLASCCEAYRCRSEKKRDEPVGLEAARYLLDAGVDPNRHEPLTSAIQGGFLELADLLLQRGARLASTKVPLARHATDVRTLRWLAERGADLNARDSEGETALSNSLSDNLEIVRFLLDAKVDVSHLASVHPSTGDNLLMHPARAGAAEALDLVLPLVKLSAEDGRKLLAEAEDPKTRAVIAKHVGLEIAPPTKLLVTELLTNAGKAQWERIAAALEKIEGQLQESSPELLQRLQTHFAEAESLELVESLRDDLKKCASLWPAANRGPLAAVVFEWAGRVTTPYDAGALSAGYAACKIEGDAATLSMPLFADCGVLGFAGLLREPEGLADEEDEVQAAVARYLAYKAAAMFNLAAGLAEQDGGFAGPSLALFVREHDQDPVLAYVVET